MTYGGVTDSAADVTVLKTVDVARGSLSPQSQHRPVACDTATAAASSSKVRIKHSRTSVWLIAAPCFRRNEIQASVYGIRSTEWHDGVTGRTSDLPSHWRRFESRSWRHWSVRQTSHCLWQQAILLYIYIGIGESWEVNRHTAQRTGSVFVHCRARLVADPAIHGWIRCPKIVHKSGGGASPIGSSMTKSGARAPLPSTPRQPRFRRMAQPRHGARVGYVSLCQNIMTLRDNSKRTEARTCTETSTLAGLSMTVL